MAKQLNEDLAKAIKKSLSGKEEVTSEGSVFNENLPEGITVKTVEQINDYTKSFVASGLKAFGEHAGEVMVKNKGIDKVAGSIALGPLGDVSYSFDREREVTPPKGEPYTQKLASMVNVHLKSGKSGVELKKARESLRDLAEKSL